MPDPIWFIGIDYDWLHAFKTPTLTWAKPLLPLFNLPPTIVSHLSLLSSLHQQIDTELTQGYNWVRENRELGEIAERDKKVLVQTIRKAFQQIAQELGNDVAREFELWARRHFVNGEVINSLFTWQSLFMTLSSSQRLIRFSSLPTKIKDSQPKFIDSLWSCIDEFIRAEPLDKLTLQVASLAPPLTPELREDGFKEHPEQLEIEHLILREWTIATLKCMASRMTSEQKQKLMAWLVDYGDVVWIDVDKTKDGDYLTTKIPLWDKPTIV